MSSWNISYSSSSFMSWSSTTTNNNGGSGGGSGNKQIRGQAYMREAHSNPTGSATRTTSQTLGQQPIQETRFYDARGRERLPHHANSQQRQPAAIAQGRVEEIADGGDDQHQQPKVANKAHKKKRVTDGSA